MMSIERIIGLSALVISGISGFFNSEIIMFYFGIVALYCALIEKKPVN